jgi:hypothetical protein
MDTVTYTYPPSYYEEETMTSQTSADMIRDILFSPCRVKTVPVPDIPDIPSTEASTQTVAATGCADDICAVCLEYPKTTNVSITACGHRFCTSCLLSSLRTKNACPACRAELEPTRNAVIEPLTATVVAETIQNEEREMDLMRRIAVINAFTDTAGRAGMIASLCRELAFGTAHSLAGWQGTSDDTYHSSWREYEYNDYNSDSDGSDSDSDDGSDATDSDSESAESVPGPGPEPGPESIVPEPSIQGTVENTETAENVVDPVEATVEAIDSIVYSSLAIRSAVTSATYLLAIVLATVVTNVMSVID